MKKDNRYIVLDYILVALFLIGIIYMYEVRAMLGGQGTGEPTVQRMQPRQSIQSTEQIHQSSVQPLSLLFARTDAERELGLGERQSLPENEGMLFFFTVPGEYGFWMKDMSFSIDMIWLDSSFRIVYIESNVSPATYPETFSPNAPSSYVLETNAGYAEENGLFVGETLDFVRDQVVATQGVQATTTVQAE